MQISPLLPTMSLFLLYQGPVQKHVFVAFTSYVSQVLSVYSFSLLLCPFYFYSLKRSVPQPVSTRGFHVTWRRSCITSVSAKHLHHKSLFFFPITIEPAQCEKLFKDTCKYSDPHQTSGFIILVTRTWINHLADVCYWWFSISVISSNILIW